MHVCRFVRVCVVSPGDHVAGMLAVAVASSRTLEVLDLEGTGLTNQSAQVRQLHVWGRPEVGVGVSQGVWTHRRGGRMESGGPP